MTLPHFVAIACGGACGALLRAFLLRLLPYNLLSGFPYALIIINVLGCFVAGLLVSSVLLKVESDAVLRAFLVTGVLGSFTTFSAFSIDTARLFSQGLTTWGIVYVVVTIVGTMGGFALGHLLPRILS